MSDPGNLPPGADHPATRVFWLRGMSPTGAERYSLWVRPAATEAEAELIRAYWDRVRLFAVRRTADAVLAEDVAQETLRRVLEALREQRLENPHALASYVFGTAQHVCQQLQRSRGREAAGMSRFEWEAGSAGQPDPLAELVSEERRQAVRTALDGLPASDRELLRMLYFERLDSETLARRLAISPGALRVRKHRALQRLSELLGEHAA